MTAVEQWRAKVQKYRRSNDLSNRSWWNSAAEWYDHWARANDYAAVIWPHIEPYVGGEVLEIGSGSGVFTEYLLPRCERVIALEPADYMGRLLHERFRGEVRLHILPLTIQEYLPRLRVYDLRFDYILAANSLYNVVEIDQMLAELLPRCRAFTIILGAGRHFEWSRILKHQYARRKRFSAPPPEKKDLLAVLDELGCVYRAESVTVPANHIFRDREGMLSWCLSYYGIPEALKTQVSLAVQPYLSQDERGVGFFGQKEWAVLHLAGGLAENSKK